MWQDQKLRLPKFLEEEEKSPEATKQVRSYNIAYVRDHIDSNDSSCAVQCPVIQAGQSDVVSQYLHDGYSPHLSKILITFCSVAGPACERCQAAAGPSVLVYS